MADDKLIFPIGFDLEEGVKQAGREWKNHYRKRLQDAIDSRPLKVKIDFESKGIDTKEFKQWMVLAREAEKIERERIKNAKEWQKVADQAAMAETRRANATNESNARIERANRKAEASERRKAKAVSDTSRAYATQSGYLQRLIQRMGVYFGLHQAASFIRNIREVTAEFELQRVALGALIQDAYKANTIFEQIKVQAVKSPYEVKDLVTYTKRLAAYGVEADDLMGTMNRLADISAGLGADMNRIILAYGQIQAAGVLKGTELRQLTELGIPMVDLLAEYYSTLRNEVVTTSEVFDMISNKEIPFKAVKDILEDLTSEGGRFFEMQAVQAETLAGQWSNMKDTLSIMFDEMGRSEEVRGLLEGFIDLVKHLALNWREVWQTLKWVGGTYAMLKSLTLAQSLYNASLTATTKGLRRYLLLTMDIPQWWKKINIATLKNIVVNIKSAFTWKSLAIGIKTATAALKQFVKTLVLATLSNPIGWITSIVSIIGLIKLKTSEGVDAMDAFRERQREMVKESVKNTTILVSNFKRLANEVINSADGSEQQAQALRRLKQQYGEIFPEWKLTVDYLRNIAEEGNNAADSFDSMASSIRSFAAEDMRQTLIENYQTQLQEQLADTFAQLTDEVGRNYADVIGMILQDFDKYATFDEFLEKVNEAYKGADWDVWQGTLADPKKYDYNLLITLAKAYYNIDSEIDRMMRSFDKLDPRLAEVNKQMKELGETLTNIEKETGGDTAENVATTIDKKRKEAIDEATRKLLESEGLSVAGNVTLDWTIANLDEIKAKAKEQGIEISDAFYEGIKQLRAFSGDYDDLWREDLANMVEYLDDGKRKVQAYSSDQITGLGTLDNALVSVAERYKDLGEEVARLKKTSDALKLKPIDEQDTKEIENYRKEISKIETIMRFLYNFLEKYGGLDLLKDEKKEQKVNPQIKQLEDELAMVEKIYKKYEEYRKTMGDAEAKALVEEYFKGVDLKWLDKAFSTTELKAQAQEALRIMKTFWGDTKKAEQNIQFKIGDIDYDETKRELEQKMKKLSDDLSRTKTAKEFFDRMLGLTGDRELSATLTMSVYGTTGDDLKSALVKQVQGAFAGQDLSKAINTDLNSIDLSALREIYNNLPEDFQEKQKQSMKQVLDMLEKGQNDLANSFAKLLMDYDEMEQKRVTITQKAAQEIATLEQGLQAQIEGIRQNKEIAAKDSAIAQAQARAEAVRKAILAREKLELSKLSPEYIRFFSSINAMAMETANSTRTQLRRALFDAFEQGGISAEELRKELKAIDTQFNKLNENATLFSSYATGGFDAWLQKLQQSADELDAIAARMMKLESIDQMDEGDKNFVNKMLRVFGGKGQKSLSDLATSFNGDMSQMGDAVQKVGGQMQGMFSSATGAIAIVDAIIKGIGQTIDGVGQVIDQINSMRSEDNQIGGWFKYIQDFNKYAQAGWEDLKSGNIAGALANTVSSIISIFQNIQADKIKKLDDEIERQQELLDNLSYAYDRLQKESEKAFGTEYIQNYNRQLANLEAQVDAYEKQLDAERSKGKKADEEKITEYKNQIQDTKDAIEDMYGSLSEYFLGTDLTSAARDFATAWIDAYKEFSNTTDAMKAKFQDMIQNMIVESLIAKVMERALRPVFDMVDNMGDSDFYSNSFWSQLMTEMNKATENGVVGAQNIMGMLESIGINLRDTGTGLTGISRDIATASEESILGLAAGINTQNFYISQVPTKLDTIIGLLRGGSTVVDSGVNVQDLITIQNQHLSHLPSIAQNTAATVARCERAAVACESMASKLGSVIKPKGTTSTHSVNVTIGS